MFIDLMVPEDLSLAFPTFYGSGGPDLMCKISGDPENVEIPELYNNFVETQDIIYTGHSNSNINTNVCQYWGPCRVPRRRAQHNTPRYATQDQPVD